MKKSIILILLIASGIVAKSQSLPDTITVTKGQYLRMDSLINVTVIKLSALIAPTLSVQQMISDIQFTQQVIGYQIQQADKKKKLLLKKKP